MKFPTRLQTMPRMVNVVIVLEGVRNLGCTRVNQLKNRRSLSHSIGDTRHVHDVGVQRSEGGHDDREGGK